MYPSLQRLPESGENLGLSDRFPRRAAGDLSAQTEILPFWLGSGSIFVTTDRLKSPDPPHRVEVVGLTVIAVCLIGGLAGGLVLFFVSGGSLYSRLIVGVVAGIVLAWAYVFGLLPKVD